MTERDGVEVALTERDGVEVALTERLVGIDSTTGSPGEAGTLLAVTDCMTEQLGDRAVVRIARTPGGVPRAALVQASADGVSPRSVLLFACHVDVVPVARPEEWTSPPFVATRVGDRLVGRGTSDMKSGLAAAMVAVADGIRAGRQVALGITTGEEAGCLGAPALLELLDPERVGAVIIPESTGNRVSLGHRGALWLTVETHGVAAHGSTPSRGVNAVTAMARVLADLGSLPLGDSEDLGAETVNVGTIRGGQVPNIVPDRCAAGIDHRTATRSGDSLVEWWRRRTDAVTVDLQLDPVRTSPENPWVRSLPARLADGPVGYFTDGSVLASSLAPDAPIVIWGPGDPAVVHTVDESVPVDAIREARHHFGAVVDAWG